MASVNNATMDARTARLHNLKSLVSKEKTIADFGRRINTDPAYISQILSAAKRGDTSRGVGSKLARKIEKAYGFPNGWMDSVDAPKDTSVPTSAQSGKARYHLDADILTQILEMIEDRRQQLGDAPQPLSVIAQVIADSYGAFVEEKERHRRRMRVIDDALKNAAREKDGRQREQESPKSRG